MSQITEEESNFLRFYFLNLKVVSKAVRAYFDSIHTPAGLAGELVRSSVTLKGLRFMTKLQLNILYPNPGRTVTSAEFDTTLIVCLLRNLPPRESAPITGWDNLPLPTDKSAGADIARIKWYRNKLVHCEDGQLSLTDFNQFWGDLEGAIRRLGGTSIHKESQSAQHVILDTSLTDMLLELRNCEKLLHEQSDKINYYLTAIDSLRTDKEDHEKKVHQLIISNKKMEAETQKLATNLSDCKGTVESCIKYIEKCRNDLKKNDEMMKELEDQSVTTKNEIEDLITEIGKLEIKNVQHAQIFKEQEEHLTMHDGQFSKQDAQLTKHGEQIETCEKSIDDLKQKQHDTDNTSVRSKQKGLEDDTKALIAEDIREGTFVTITALAGGLSLLQQNGVLLITGHAGTGKSRIGRHVLHMFCTNDTSYKCIKLNSLKEWEAFGNREENFVVLIDDIFGETNCIYNREKAIPILDKVHAYVCKGNIKVVITIRDTVKRQCQEVFDSHRLFQFDFIDLSSDKYELSWQEKEDMLTNYMKTVRQSHYTVYKGFMDDNGDIILNDNDVWKITGQNPVKGFPLVVYQFVNNEKYFELGSKFFDRPTETMLEEMHVIRRKGEDHRNFMIQYSVIVYIAIHDNCIYPDDSSIVTEIPKIIDAIYGETIKVKKCHISDAVKKLKGSYLVNNPNQISYRLHHPTLRESAILSFAQIDEEFINKIIPLISWSFFLKMVKPESYKENDGEVVLKIPINSYEILADKLVDLGESIHECDRFIHNLCHTEIFQQEYCQLLPLLLDAFEKEYKKDRYMAHISRCSETDMFDFVWNTVHKKNKDIFLANVLVTSAKLESQLELYTFVLNTVKTVVKTGSSRFTIDYIKSALISSLYVICSTKDLGCVKATMDIVEEYTIPVLLDQGVTPTNIPNISSVFLETYDDKTCVFLTKCIWNAYEVFNIPVLEFLLLKYSQIPFDINLFFKMMYKDEWIQKVIQLSREKVLGWPLLSFKPLKWMIETFKYQELDDINFILIIACKYQMFDTVEYLASRSKTVDVISCLQAFVDKADKSFVTKIPFHQELFNFLLTKIDITSKELIPIVKSIIQKEDVPDYIFDAFIPVCLDNTDILALACNFPQFYLVNLIIESSNIEHLDIQLALIAACKRNNSILFHIFKADVEVAHLKIIKYIVEKFGSEQLDYKIVCQEAYSSEQFQIIEWFVQNIDITRLDVYTIINSALVCKRSDILEHIMNKIEIESLDKKEVLKSVTEHFTDECSTTILDIVSTIWCSTEDKEVLNMEEIVNTAYALKCFELLMWIQENCFPHISIDGNEVLMLACENFRVDVAKWVLQTFQLKPINIDGEQLFMMAFSKKPFYFRYDGMQEFRIENKLMNTLNWILATFQINHLDIISGVLKLISVDKEMINNDVYNIVVSLLEKYLSNQRTGDVKEIINMYLQRKHYAIVNWFLQNENCCSFDRQRILNNACGDAEIETVKMLRKYFYCLDMNQAMKHAFNSKYYGFESKSRCLNGHPIFAFLDLLWKEIDHDSIDINAIVRTVCQGKHSGSNVTRAWILLTIPHHKFPINEVLIKCCQQREIHHVKYIFHEVDNEQLEVEEAFVRACSERNRWGKYCAEDLCVVDFLFQKLQDKTSSLSLALTELLRKKNFDHLLYFLREGYYRNIDMKNLMNLACINGHIGLVQWILSNVEHKELDIKSAFLEASDIQLDGNKTLGQNRLKCLTIIWHYNKDLNMCEIDKVLKTITESHSGTFHMFGFGSKLSADFSFDSVDDLSLNADSDLGFDSSDDSDFFVNFNMDDSYTQNDLRDWLLHIKNIKQRISQCENAFYNTEEI